MHGDLLLHRREVAINGIGGVGDTKLGVPLIGKQIGNIALEGQVRTAHILVRVVPVFGTKDAGLLCIEVMPLLLPHFELLSELLFIRFGERECERTQLSTCVSFGPSREVLRHDLQLVEVTHLYGDVFKNGG